MGNYLSNRRKALGLTQRQIAELVDVSEATVSRWESGEIANMRRDRIAAYAKALKTTPSFIMSGEEPQTATPAPVVLTAPQSILPRSPRFWRPLISSTRRARVRSSATLRT